MDEVLFTQTMAVALRTKNVRALHVLMALTSLQPKGEVRDARRALIHVAIQNINLLKILM